MSSVSHSPPAKPQALRLGLCNLPQDWPEIQIQAGVEIRCDALLVAAGRVANVEGLGLEAAGVECSASGIKVTDDLVTSNPDILAIGDVIERVDTRFTHMSGTMAGMAAPRLLRRTWKIRSNDET